MKRLVLTIVISLITLSSFAQENKIVAKDSLILTARDSLFFSYLQSYQSQLREPRYRLFPTQNNWTFIKLDTLTGQLWQVQYSVDDSPRMEYTLDSEIRLRSYQEPICGRYTLYETKNMYNFILLDTIDGLLWQVQWSIDEKNRAVLRIY